MSIFSGSALAVPRRQAEVDHHHCGQRQRHVDPEHVLPATGQPDDEDSVERTEHTAQLLRGTDPAEHSRAVALGPQVGAQCERYRQQSAAGHALDGAADHQDIQIGGQRRDHRADQEGGQADLEQQFAPESVRCPAQQRHRGDVAQQIPGDDRGDPLQVVDRDPDGADDVAHDRDDDIGVEGSEQDGQAAGADRDDAPRMMRLGCRHEPGATGGLVT